MRKRSSKKVELGYASVQFAQSGETVPVRKQNGAQQSAPTRRESSNLGEERPTTDSRTFLWRAHVIAKALPGLENVHFTRTSGKQDQERGALIHCMAWRLEMAERGGPSMCAGEIQRGCGARYHFDETDTSAVGFHWAA